MPRPKLIAPNCTSAAIDVISYAFRYRPTFRR